MGCGSLNRIIFTDRFIRNRRDRDKFEYKNAQQMFCSKLKESGVFVNGNGLYHFSMAHTPDVLRTLIAIIKGACNQNA